MLLVVMFSCSISSVVAGDGTARYRIAASGTSAPREVKG
jgi:hypothetical protein